jgi:hypothetical protein
VSKLQPFDGFLLKAIDLKNHSNGKLIFVVTGDAIELVYGG